MSSKTSQSKLLSPATTPDDTFDYAQLFQVLPDRYALFRTDDPDFTFVDVNAAHCAMTGVSRDKIIGRPFFAVFPDVTEHFKRTGVSEVRQLFQMVVATKESQESSIFRYDIRDQNGKFIEKYWRTTQYPILNKTGAVTYILQSSHDATDELQTSTMLRETQAQLGDALNIGKVGSWLWDVERNVVVANHTLAELFGIDTETAHRGLAIHEFMNSIHPEDRTRVLKEINNAIEQNRSFESEYRTVSTDGTLHWVLARGRLEIDKNGRSARFPGVIVDITERHNFETQLEEAKIREEVNRREAALLQRRNEELESLSRTKDEFVALASHQLRTPATAVKQYLGMVLQGYVGDITETQTDMLDRAFQSNERQIEIINQILNAARVDTGRLVMAPAPLDIRTQLSGIADEMRSSIEETGHKFITDLGSEPVTAFADSGYLRMAVENVVHNASIYTPVPGHIWIKLEKTDKVARISIRDDGVGIKKADIHKLFTKFSRIHNTLSVQAGGSGIGLYLAAEILRLHGGEITVDSKSGKGTTFTLTLPLLL